MASRHGNAAIKPSHRVEHDRITEHFPVTGVAPASERTTEYADHSVPTIIRDCGVAGPVASIPIAIMVGFVGVLVPSDRRLLLHRRSISGGRSLSIPWRRICIHGSAMRRCEPG